MKLEIDTAKISRFLGAFHYKASALNRGIAFMGITATGFLTAPIIAHLTAATFGCPIDSPGIVVVYVAWVIANTIVSATIACNGVDI